MAGYRKLEIGLFVDESGESGSESKCYLLTWVFHEQRDGLSLPLRMHEDDLRAKGLPDITPHASAGSRG